MTLFYLVIIALIQGITEFLPVSSSGHLILAARFLGQGDQGQFIDVAVHLGTLGAVMFFFWADLRVALRGLPKMLRGDLSDPGARLAFLLAIATVPAVLFGLILAFTGLDDVMRSAKVIGWTMLGFGILLWIADRRGQDGEGALQDKDWSLRHAIIMGVWQAVALIPGTSRSGITITGARFLGYERRDAAKLSMLMSIPVIIASGSFVALDAVGETSADDLRNGALAALFAFLSALAALGLMMRLLRSVSFTPYVIYRIALGLVLLAISYDIGGVAA